MARGHLTAETARKREERTEQLFAELESESDPTARHDIVEALAETNLPLCDALARRYAGRGCDHDDLVQVARVGLLLAIDRYRPVGEGAFVAFAVPTITGELKRYFRDSCWTIRPPRRVQELRLLVRDSAEELTQRHGHEPSVIELAAHLGEESGQVRECLAVATSYAPVSLDSHAGHDAQASVGDLLAADDTAIDEVLLRLDLRRAVERLPLLEQRVVSWRFSGELTQSQIAARIGVSQMQVSRILRRALDRLRGSFEETATLAG